MRKLLFLWLFILTSLQVAAQIPIEGKVLPLRQGDKVANASDIETTGNSNAQTDLNRIGTSILNWKFNATVTDGTNPGSTFFALNNAAKDDATIVTFHIQSNNDAARFGDLLEDLGQDDRMWLQERDAVNTSILYRITGNATLSGSQVNVPVVREDDEGLEFTDQSVVNVYFHHQGGGTPVLPNQFLNEITETDQTIFDNNKIDTEAVIRFWFRQNLVTDASAGGGAGLLIADSNGDLPEDGDTYQDDENHWNEYLYIGTTVSYATSITTSNFWVIIKDIDGREIQRLNLGTNFTDVGSLGTGSNRYFVSSSGGFGGTFPNYNAGQTVELFEQGTDRRFSISQANEDNVNITRGIKDVPIDRLSVDLQAEIESSDGVPFDDQFKLDQFVEVTSTSTSGLLTGSTQILAKTGGFSENSNDYTTSTFDIGLPPSIGTTTTWYVAIPHQYNVTGFQGIDGTTSTTLFKSNIVLEPSAKNNNQRLSYNIYTIAIPDAIASDPTNLVPIGTLTNITQIDPSELVKLRRVNFESNFLNEIQSGTNSTELTNFENKVNTLYPLSTFVDILRAWGSIYDPAQTTENVGIVGGYSLLADYRASDDKYESPGVVLTPGVGVLTYTGLTSDYRRGFGFKVTAPSDQVLLWIVDGATRIPYVDMTAAGNYRVNNFTPATTQDVDVANQLTYLSLSSGSTTLTTVEPPPRAEYIIPDFPIGATNASQSIDVDLDVLVNGVNTLGGGFITFSIPVTPTEQSRSDQQHTFNLGPAYNNRRVTVTIGHRLRIVASAYQLDLTLQEAPSDVSLLVESVGLIRNYTAAQTTARVDNWEIFTDGGSNYTFTGENELVIAFHPYDISNSMNVVGVAVNASGTVSELNDRLTIETPGAFSSVEVPNTIEFRTWLGDHYLRHIDLSSLLANRAIKWVYALARLNTVTVHSVTEPIDLAAGTTIGGASPGGRTWQDAQLFTAAANVTVNLPVNTTVANFERCAITWHTGVGTATDNNNRDYVDYFDFHQIINHTRTLIFIGGRGRGAENYGIEVTKPLSTATSITFEIVNLNDLGGATLPTGSLITDVEFY